MENWKIVVCPKCHKEFKDVILFPHHGRKCPHCGEIQMVYTIESSKRNNRYDAIFTMIRKLSEYCN